MHSRWHKLNEAGCKRAAPCERTQPLLTKRGTPSPTAGVGSVEEGLEGQQAKAANQLIVLKLFFGSLCGAYHATCR